MAARDHMVSPDECPVTGQPRTDEHRVCWSGPGGSFTQCPQCDPGGGPGAGDVLSAIAARRRAAAAVRPYDRGRFEVWSQPLGGWYSTLE
jgi:hypothetical protein